MNAPGLRIDSPPCLVRKRRPYKKRIVPESSKFRQLIALQEEYILALAGELSEIIENGFAHGWVSERTAEISALRCKIKDARKQLHVAA